VGPLRALQGAFTSHFSLTVAVGQPTCVPGDAQANAANHAEIVRAARARLVAFPELSLTGYDLASPAIAPADDLFAPIVDACSKSGSTALVGAPLLEGDAQFIATFAVTGAGVAVAYRKSYLGGEEARRFAHGHGPAVLEVSGCRVGLGICKDTSIPAHIDAVLALGVDLYVAGLVHHANELPDQDARAARIIRRGGIPVAFASAAGDVGTNYPMAAGHSCIWSADGSVLARATDTPGELARAAVVLRS
jgi:predicted amidohydrolase